MFNLANKAPTQGKTVNYCGSDVTVPAHHNWAAVIMLGAAAMNRCMLATFANKPVVSESGLQWMPADADYTVIAEVSDVPVDQLLNSLQQVDGFTDNVQIAHANTRELVYKMIHELETQETPAEALHAIFCPEHGVFSDFLRYSGETIGNLFFGEDEEEADEFIKELVGEPVASTDFAVRLANDLAAELEKKFPNSNKPRIRVVEGVSLEDLLAGFPTGKA